MLAPFCRVVLKSGPFRIHFQHSGAKLRGFEQNTDIIKLWLSYSMTANIFCFGRKEQPAKSLVITHASHVCSYHLFGPPLRMNRIYRTQFEHARFNLLPLNLITHVWTICHEKPTQSTHCTGAKTFDLGSSSPTLLNLWLLHVQVYLYISSCH